jgi:iron uptake system EfeUOB component EfeO/EfeM
LHRNNDRFGYRRFDYLSLEDRADMPTNLNTLSERVRRFFDGAP